MKLISSLLISLTLVGLATSCFKGKGEIPTGFLGSEGLISFSIDDDISNSLLWNSVSGGTITGNVLNPVISGACGDALQVQIWVDGSIKKTASCISKRFHLSLSGADAFTNGVYSLQFMTVPASVSLDRTYDVLSLDPNTLVTLGSVPAFSINDDIDYSLTCNSRLTLSLAGAAVDCSNGEVKTQNIALVMGTNSFTVTWIDSHHNSGVHIYSLIRNPPGVPEVTAGMISATGNEAISLSNCEGDCDGTMLSNVTIHGLGAGVTHQDIPLSRAPSSGGGGETISLGNQSYIFCEHQNISGECIP
jgi:hypothetical protein